MMDNGHVLNIPFLSFFLASLLSYSLSLLLLTSRLCSSMSREELREETGKQNSKPLEIKLS